RLSHLIFGLKNFTSALREALVVQTEHAREKSPIGAAEKGSEGAVSRGERIIVRRQQCISVALAAANLNVVPVMLQHAAQSHGSVIVNKVVWRIVGNSEQEVFNGGKRGRFAGFVG